MQLDSKVVSQTVAVTADVAYAFARQMTNLPQWATGLASGVRRKDGVWYAESPMGRVAVAIAKKNSFGVLDHDVTLPDGKTVHNALRVSPCGDGCVLTFVVLRQPGDGAERFAADVTHVRRDLRALNRVLERQ